jgi:hypothetical protein
MSQEDNKNYESIIQKEIEDTLSNFEIDEIQCHSNKLILEKWNWEKVNSHLEGNVYNKIEINTCYPINKKGNVEKILDINALLESVNQCLFKLKMAIDKLDNKHPNKFELNEVFKKIIKQVDVFISKMNYTEWTKTKDPYNNNIFYVLIDKEKRPFSKMVLDTETRCQHQINFDFDIRVSTLYNLKAGIINLYSEYIIYADIETLPTFKFKKNKTDLIELILGLDVSNSIDKMEEFKTLILALFNFKKTDYHKGIDNIKTRQNNRATYLYTLYKEINNHEF